MALEGVGPVFDATGAFTLSFRFASQGALQALSMTNKFWLVNAYLLAPSAWKAIDMFEWPFALKEYRAERACMESTRLGFEHMQADVDVGGVRCRPDSMAIDADLRNAFKHIKTGMVEQLVACSSLLSNDGVASLLQQHGQALRSLCLGSSGSKLLSGLSLLACPPLSGLKKLEVHDIAGLPLQELAKACDLEQLLVRFDNRSAFLDVRAICHFRNLQVLKITTASTRKSGLPWQPFWDLFASCGQLRVVHLYGSVEMSNGLLLRIMTSLHNLEDFVGSRCEWGVGPRQEGEFPFPEGARVVEMCDLHSTVIEAFTQHYSNAARVLIDDVFGAGLTDENGEW